MSFNHRNKQRITHKHFQPMCYPLLISVIERPKINDLCQMEEVKKKEEKQSKPKERREAGGFFFFFWLRFLTT